MEKYSGPVSIDSKELDDLYKMLAFIPTAYHSFYHSIHSESRTVDSDAEYIDSETED